MLSFYCFSAGSFAAPDSFAQQDSGELQRKVDKVFAAYDKPDSPGCALGVVRDGEFVYKKGYGEGSLKLSVPLTPQSVFYMGSVSKQFTAASVVLAAEQGYLSLDDDVRKYVPEIPSYGKPITLREMLHHTSGFRDILGLLILAGRNSGHPSHPRIARPALPSKSPQLQARRRISLQQHKFFSFQRNYQARHRQAPLSIRRRKYFQAARHDPYALLS